MASTLNTTYVWCRVLLCHPTLLICVWSLLSTTTSLRGFPLFKQMLLRSALSEHDWRGGVSSLEGGWWKSKSRKNFVAWWWWWCTMKMHCGSPLLFPTRNRRLLYTVPFQCHICHLTVQHAMHGRGCAHAAPHQGSERPDCTPGGE